MTRTTADLRSVARLRDLHPTLRFRLAIAFVERALNTMLIPLMAIYLSATVGSSTAGLLILVSVCVAVVAGLASGHIADLLGRRQALLGGSATMAVGFVGMAIAAAPWWSSPWIVFGFYLLQAAATSFIQPVHDAVIIDVTVPEERKVVYTINYWSFNIALATGALLGGFLYEEHFVGLLIGGSVCAIGATALTYRFLEETAPPVHSAGIRPSGIGPARQVFSGYTVAFRDRRFMALLIAMTLILGLEMQRTSGFVAVRVAQDVPTQGLVPFGTWSAEVSGVQLLGVLQASNTVCVAVLALISGRLLRKANDRKSVLVGVTLFTGACVVLATSDVASVLLLAMLVLTLGELLHIPVMQSVLADVVPDHLRTRYMAVFNLNVRGGMVIASLSLSAAGLLSPASMGGIFIVIGLGAAFLYRSLLPGSRHRGRHRKPQPSALRRSRRSRIAAPPPQLSERALT